MLLRISRPSHVWRVTVCRCCVRRWRVRQTMPAMDHIRGLHTAPVVLAAAAEGPSQAAEGSEEVKVQLEPTPEELENEEPWMQEEIKAYYRGRKRLAEIMGREPHTFTDQDVKDSLGYLLPTRLTDKGARPFLKHPSEIFPKRTASAFDVATGRPLEPAFYTGSPGYHNLIYKIFEQRGKLEEADKRLHMMSGPSQHGDGGEGERAQEAVERGDRKDDERGVKVPMHWIKKEAMANYVAEEISDQQYKDLLSRLQQLADHAHNTEIAEFLDQFRRPVFIYRSHAHIPTVGEGGKARAIGRRKTSCAEVWLGRGRGRVIINGKPFIDYFPRVVDRQQVLYPLLLVGFLGEYDVTARVWGGGVTGQAGAIRLGISKALLAFPGDHGDQLEKAGLLVRDPRMVERKKPGQKKARKKFTWVKR